jgi:hypothetical protein
MIVSSSNILWLFFALHGPHFPSSYLFLNLVDTSYNVVILMSKIPRYRIYYLHVYILLLYALLRACSQNICGVDTDADPAVVGLDELAMPCFTISLILSILHSFLPLQPGKKGRAPPPSDLTCPSDPMMHFRADRIY